ncbi:MAG: hypothetical protein GY866_08590 [Proteobacteria bacterium]|nr:hypothetical protein [Pseudomonadota bacterium]
MAYLIGIVVFILALVLGVVSYSGLEGLALFWNLPALFLIVVPALAFSLSSNSLKGVKIAGILFGKHSETDREKAGRGYRFFRILGNASLLLGLIAFFISLIVLLANLGDTNSIGHTIALGLLSMLYAVCLKTLAYSAECRLRKKAGLLEDSLTLDGPAWSVYLYPILPLLLMFILLFAMSTPERIPAESTDVDSNTGKEWQVDFIKGMPRAEAHFYCKYLIFSNKTDWRLPTSAELNKRNRDKTESARPVTTWFWASDSEKTDSKEIRKVRCIRDR